MAHSKRRAILAHFKLHRTTCVAGAVVTALFVAQLPAMAQPASDPAHAIANRFAEDATRAEAQRKAAAHREAERRREQAARAKAQKAYEAEMLRRARTESEERRKLEEEAARLDAIRVEREAREAKAAQERGEKDRQIEAAQAAEKARLAEETRKAEEAKRAAEALRIAAEQAAAEEARKAEEIKRAETQRVAEEARKLEANRKAEETRRLAAERAAEQTARAEAEKRDAEARRVVERATADELRRVSDLEGEAEIARVAERLRRIREEHLARHTGPAAAPPVAPTAVTTPSPEVQTVAGPVVDTRDERLHEPSSGRGRIAGYDERRDVPLPPARGRPGQPPPAYQTPEPKLAFDGHVTVLLQMEPRYRRGRRYESMDPVLCTAEGCYVSNGPEEPASFLYGRGATRFGNAIGRRAGACNHTYTCVFRNVDLGRLPAELQPVDIRIIRHDRRSPEWVEALSNCRMTVGNRLTCTGAIEGDGYTMWVISEMAAERLPLHAFSGIADGERAEADPKLMGPRERW